MQMRKSHGSESEWQDLTLGDVLTLQRGFDLPVSRRVPGPYPVIASTGSVGTHHAAAVKGPGVVIGRSGSIGGGQFIRADFWPLNTTLWVKDFKGNDIRFCYYFLKSLELDRFNAGTGVPTLNRNHIHPLAVKIPSVATQNAIAHILGTLDDKIELNRRISETLEEMARVLFKSWFVDFDPVRAKAALASPPPDNSDWTVERARAYLDSMDEKVVDLFPDRLVDSELGEIPEGWEVRAFSDCVEVARGLSYKGSGLSIDGIPMHNLNSVYEGGGYKYEGIKYYRGDYQERHVAQSGDVVVANTEQGHDRLLIGYAAIIPQRFSGVSIFSHHLYRIRPTPDSGIPPDFLCQIFNSTEVQDAVSGYATGTTVNMLPLDALRIPNTVIPPAKLMNTYSAIAQVARSRQEKCIQESRSLTGQRDHLLPKLVSGEMRLGEFRNLA